MATTLQVDLKLTAAFRGKKKNQSIPETMTKAMTGEETGLDEHGFGTSVLFDEVLVRAGDPGEVNI